jgi:hypothetical protein
MVTLLLLLWLVPGCFGSVIGSGNLETRDFDYSDFTRLEVGNAFRVEVNPSESFSISITLDDNMFDYLYVSKSGETLKIRLKSGYRYSNHTAIAEVAMPEIQRLELSGATSGTVEGFSSIRDFTAEISGASSLDIAFMTTGGVDFGLSGASRLAGNIVAGGDARFNLSGASSIALSGSADDLNADASGASHLELDDFTVRNANIEFSGASNGTVNMDGTLNVDLSGASHLYYIGEVILGDIDISGGSSISRK